MTVLEMGLTLPSKTIKTLDKIKQSFSNARQHANKKGNFQRQEENRETL